LVSFEYVHLNIAKRFNNASEPYIIVMSFIAFCATTTIFLSYYNGPVKSALE